MKNNTTKSNSAYAQMKYVTGPVKIEHMGTNYTLLHNRLYLDTRKEYNLYFEAN